MNYKVINSFTLQDIMTKNPCHSEMNNLLREYTDKKVDYTNVFSSWDECMEFNTLKNNTKWLIDEGFIEKIKEFKPFDLKIRVESEDMLKALYGTVNTPVSKRTKYNFEDIIDLYLKYEMKIFRPIDNEMYRLKD